MCICVRMCMSTAVVCVPCAGDLQPALVWCCPHRPGVTHASQLPQPPKLPWCCPFCPGATALPLCCPHCAHAACTALVRLAPGSLCSGWGCCALGPFQAPSLAPRLCRLACPRLTFHDPEGLPMGADGPWPRCMEARTATDARE